MKFQGTEFRSQGFKLYWYYLEVKHFFHKNTRGSAQTDAVATISVPMQADSNVTSGVYLFKMLEMLDWKKHKLESRLPGEISITSDMQMTPPLWQKVKRN